MSSFAHTHDDILRHIPDSERGAVLSFLSASSKKPSTSEEVTEALLASLALKSALTKRAV